MKKVLFMMILSLQVQVSGLAGTGEIVAHFDRPWFPQWELGQEVSNPAFGYRLEGMPVDLIIYGYDLDKFETIEIQNRDDLGRVVSSGQIQADESGKCYLRIETDLSDSFSPEKIYSMWAVRESGEEIRIGGFYVDHAPPDEFLYKSIANLTYGFSVDESGKPYLLSWLSHRNGPNLLDTIGDRGREFQGDLVDGFPHDGDDWRYNTVVPCQGGGDYGHELPTVTKSVTELDYVYARTKPLDYEPDRSEMNGWYRQKVLRDRWPETGWNLDTEYRLTGNDVTLRNRFWHEDNYNHRVHQIRTAQIFLNPVFFQTGPMNAKRDPDSYLQARIDADKIEVYSDALGIKLTFRAGVDNYNSYYNQRQWNYNQFYDLAEPGNVQVWEALNIAEINELVPANKILSGWGKLSVVEADKLGIGFDMEKFKRYMRMIYEQRNFWGGE